MMTECPSRELNVICLVDYLDARVSHYRGDRRGRLNQQDQMELDNIQSAARKLRTCEETAGKILQELEDLRDSTTAPTSQAGGDEVHGRGASSSSAGPPTRKMRHLRGKSLSDGGMSSSQDHPARSPLYRRSVNYRHHLGQDFRTRRQVDGLGTQSCPQRIQKVLVPHTKDLDIENCCFSLTWQLVEMLELRYPIPEDIKDVMRRCALERDAVCTDMLKMNLPEGKQVLNSVFNGGRPPRGLEQNEFLKGLQRASRFMRWLACSLALDLYSHNSEDPKRLFPTATTCTYVWMAIEDRILTSIIDWMNRYPLQHLSLHFDGVRVFGGGDFMDDVNKLRQECSGRV